jgi:hypothetical protein
VPLSVTVTDDESITVSLDDDESKTDPKKILLKKTEFELTVMPFPPSSIFSADTRGASIATL